MKSTNNILLVEDSAGDRMLIARKLKKLNSNCNVLEMENGELAVNYLSQIRSQYEIPVPDIILLDLNMPGMNGLEVLKRLKADQMLKVIPVIMFTSSQLEKDIIKCYREQANAYVVKPVNYEDYDLAIESIFSHWFSTASLPALKYE
jgi:two-component system response regulator